MDLAEYIAQAETLFGSALFSGTTGWAITGVLLAASILIVVRLLQKRLAPKVAQPTPISSDLLP